MLAHQFNEAVAAARNAAALDNTARLLWRAHAEGAIADAEAEAIAASVQARRAAFSRPGMSKALSCIAAASAPRRPVRPRSPDKQASIERRRRCALSGAVPSRIAASFTLGEAAVLSVVAGQVRKSGQSLLPIDALAALAGVSRSTVKNAIRTAERLGLIQRIERRRRGLPSLSNILRIVAADWLTWLKLRKQWVGGKNSTPTYNQIHTKGKSGDKSACERGVGWRVQGVSAMFRQKQKNSSENGGA